MKPVYKFTLLCINSQLESKNLPPYASSPVRISPGPAPCKAVPKGFACGFVGLPPKPPKSLFITATVTE